MTKEDIEKKRLKEQKTVEEMIRLYCRKRHGKTELCEDCAELLQYASERSARCPFMENKTFCSNCKVHCYRKDMREKIQAVMRFAGPRMLLSHPAMALSHVYYSKKERRRMRREDAHGKPSV